MKVTEGDVPDREVVRMVSGGEGGPVCLVAFGLGGQDFGTRDGANLFQSFTGGSFRVSACDEDRRNASVCLALEVLVVVADRR